jgi:Holliday junction resolvase
MQMTLSPMARFYRRALAGVRLLDGTGQNAVRFGRMVVLKIEIPNIVVLRKETTILVEVARSWK